MKELNYKPNTYASKRLTGYVCYILLATVFIMSRNKEQEVKDVREAIKSIANDIVASKGTKGHTNETYDEEVRKAEFMLQSLCEMYHIAHYR